MRLHLVWVLIVFAFSGCADKYEHDPTLAAKTAEQFATLAFVKQDYDGAYALLADGMRRHVSPAQFKQTLIKNQSGVAPTRITAKEYEPMSGEKAIYIYLSAERGGDQYGYRITVEGTSAGGYKVLRFDRGGGLNLPGGDRRPLKG